MSSRAQSTTRARPAQPGSPTRVGLGRAVGEAREVVDRRLAEVGLRVVVGEAIGQLVEIDPAP
jgi:hypothetical protein